MINLKNIHWIPVASSKENTRSLYISRDNGVKKIIFIKVCMFYTVGFSNLCMDHCNNQCLYLNFSYCLSYQSNVVSLNLILFAKLFLKCKLFFIFHIKSDGA